MAGRSAWQTLLLRYGEIGIKSPAVRSRWEKRLAENVEQAFVRRGIEGQVVRERGRMFVHTNDEAAAIEVLKRTFGVVSASAIEEVPATLDAITEKLVDASRGAIPKGASFAVRARRTGEHAFTSMELQKHVGSAIYRANEDASPRVDLVSPDVEFHVEVRNDRAFTYRHVIPGPGGLPLGTQGRVVVLLDSPRAALAAWLVMKRGCTPLFLAPSRAAARPEVEAAARALALWAPVVRAARVDAPPEWRDDAAAERAFLLRAAGALARPRKGQAVVVGDGFAGALALSPLDRLAGLPVFRPLTGFMGAALADLALQAGIPGVLAEGTPAPASPMEVPADLVRDALRAQEPWEVRAA